MLKETLKKLIPPFLISCYHFFLSFLAALFYRFPSKKMVVIGITGTNGKSTVVDLTARILEEAGYKIASLSSIKFKIKEKEWPNTLRMTMPGRFQLQKFLRQAVNYGCNFAILEVTSEGIKQYRHKFINFQVAAFTNLAPEHIEAHGSFEKYREAKLRFFHATKKTHIINLDDENADYFWKIPAREKIGYTILVSKKGEGIVRADNIQVLPSGLKFSVENKEFGLKLLGAFNISNALSAISVGLSQGVSLEICKLALEKAKSIPGRMEKVIAQPFKVFVDYAFTPNALEKVYRTLKTNDSKLICVLGACGGGRDKWKRPVLGKIAAQYCNEVIVTNEDPYDEEPMEIINQVASGAGEKAKKILDRRKAILEALKIARREDTVIITGKGCEPSICIAGDKKIPWDDREVVREEVKKLQFYEKILPQPHPPPIKGDEYKI